MIISQTGTDDAQGKSSDATNACKRSDIEYSVLKKRNFTKKYRVFCVLFSKPSICPVIKMLSLTFEE